jgi:hypothetical protein
MRLPGRKKSRTAVITKRLRNLTMDNTPRARAVMRAFNHAKKLAASFRMSSGLLPEVSESCSARLFDIVQHIGAKHFGTRKPETRLRAALKRALPSPEAFDRVDRELAELRASEIQAAYVFGLSVGLANPAIEADSAG